MSVIKKISFPFALAVLLYLSACQQPSGNRTGSEYMPDMGHSIAYEANYYNYYSLNTWGSEEEYYQFAQPRQPVNGTIPRGYAGSSDVSDGIQFSPNGSVPYYYGDTDDERLRATDEIISNPFPITDKGLSHGKELYDVYCGICHGDKGDGVGYLVRDPSPGDLGGMYPVQPANMLLEEFVNDTNGRYYHAIIYGKNMMGGYTDKLSYEERWQVIHYVRSLQAKSLGLEYNQMVNTLNNVDHPAGEIVIHEEEVKGESVSDHDDHHESQSHH